VSTAKQTVTAAGLSRLCVVTIELRRAGAERRLLSLVTRAAAVAGRRPTPTVVAQPAASAGEI